MKVVEGCCVELRFCDELEMSLNGTLLRQNLSRVRHATSRARWRLADVRWNRLVEQLDKTAMSNSKMDNAQTMDGL